MVVAFSMCIICLLMAGKSVYYSIGSFSWTLPELVLCMFYYYTILFQKVLLIFCQDLKCPPLTYYVIRWHMDWDSGLCAVLGNSQYCDRWSDTFQWTGICGRSQARPEGEAWMNVCVWKAVLPLQAQCPNCFISLFPKSASAGLESILTNGHQCRSCVLQWLKDKDWWCIGMLLYTLLPCGQTLCLHVLLELDDLNTFKGTFLISLKCCGTHVKLLLVGNQYCYWLPTEPALADVAP